MTVLQDDLSNLPSERLILGGIFQHGDEAFVDVNSIISADSFTDSKNQNVYTALKVCLERGLSVDLPSFFSAASDIGLSKTFEKEEYVDHINRLRSTKVNLENVNKHAKIIRRLQYARELQSKIKEGYSQLKSVTGNESLLEIQSIAESPIQTLSLQYQKGDESGIVQLGDGIDDYFTNLIENPESMKGISTGFPIYDKMIGGGLNRQCVDIIAARKKEGKSFIADNFAYYIAATQNIPVLVLDTEMKQSEHWDRLLARLTRIEINEIKFAEFTKDPGKVKRLKAASEHLKQIPFRYSKVAGKKFTDILSIIRRWIMRDVGYDSNGKLNDCVLIYDYFKMTDTDSLNSMSEWQALGYQMTALKDFCAEYDFPIQTFVQTNREGVTVEDSTIVARSDAIMDTATSLTIFKSKTPEEIANDGGIRCGNKKLVGVMYRHGPGLENDYVNLQFEGAYGTIKELGSANSMRNRQSGLQTTIDEEEHELNENT